MTHPDRRKLTAEVVARAEELAALGLPLQSIADGIGVHRSTLREWLQAGQEPDAHPLESALVAAIHGGSARGQEQLISNLHRMAAAGSEKAASWLLTHSPRWRETWSDAAATKRELQRAMTVVVEVIRSSPIPLEEQHRVLLDMQARGLGAEPPALPPADG